MELEQGDILKREVKVIKAKNGTATKVKIDGKEYALVPQDYINGHKNKFTTESKNKQAAL